MLNMLNEDERLLTELKSQFIIPALHSNYILLHLVNDILDYS